MNKRDKLIYFLFGAIICISLFTGIGILYGVERTVFSVSSDGNVLSYRLNNSGYVIFNPENDTITCGTNLTGALYYNGSYFYACDGSSWQKILWGTTTGTVTSLSQGTGLTFSANPITTTGTISLNTNTKMANATWCDNTSGINWNKISEIPAGFADGTDDGSGSSDGNNYTTAISVSGTTTKNISLQRNGMGNLTAVFTDIDTTCAADSSCSDITYDSETSTWDKDTTNDQVEANAFKNANYSLLENNAWRLENTTALGYQIEASAFKIENETDSDSLHLNQDNFYEDGWVVYTAGTQMFSFNETKLMTTYFNATNQSVITGTLSGLMNMIYRYDDISFNITEQAASPALDYRVNFTGVSGINQIVVRYKTTSTPEPHTAIVYLWDYDDGDWEQYLQLTDTSSAWQVKQIGVFDEAGHLSGGEVRMRIIISSTGNVNHNWLFDWIQVADGYSTPSAGEIDPYSIHKADMLNTTTFYFDDYLQFNYTYHNSIYQKEVSAFKKANYSAMEDNAFRIANFTAQLNLINYQNETNAWKKSNYSAMEDNAFRIANFTAQLALINYQNETNSYKNANFTAQYDAITSRFLIANYTSLESSAWNWANNASAVNTTITNALSVKHQNGTEINISNLGMTGTKIAAPNGIYIQFNATHGCLGGC